jgi:glycosyltransferase involved in cell wall biosynthesis
MLVDPLDVAGLAGALEQVFTDAALARRLRDEGIARARRFSWPESARTLIDAYAEARRRGASRRASQQGLRA